MASDWILNGGITMSRPIEVDDKSLTKFASALRSVFPMMTETKQDIKEGKFTLYEQGRSTPTREVMVSKKNGIQAGASEDLTPEEQREFVFSAIDKAEDLGISKLNVDVVDLRVMFKIKHWGNHHELIGKAVLAGSPLQALIDEMKVPMSDIDLRTVLMLDTDLRAALLFVTQTSLAEIRSGDYDGDALAVVCGIARTGGFVKFDTFGEIIRELGKIWDSQLSEGVLSKLVKPIRMLAVGKRDRTFPGDQ